MKIFITTICLLLAFTISRAQGNLQFNEVKLVTAAQTVPAGKVWKIEGVTYNQTPTPRGVYASQDASIMINGTSTVVRTVRHDGYYYFVWESKFPIWLTGGNTLGPSTGVLFISVLEFNAVP